MKRLSIVLSICMLLLANLILLFKLSHTKQLYYQQNEVIAKYQEQYDYLYGFTVHAFRLNDINISSFCDIMKATPGLSEQSFLAFCPQDLCSSCLLSLIDLFNENNIDSNEVVFVLETTNRYLEDELDANGFRYCVLFDVFQFLESNGSIILAKKKDNIYSLVCYDTKVDPILITSYITNVL